MAAQPSTEPHHAKITARIDGNHFSLLETGQERIAALLELINGAKESLRLVFYIFASDECGQAVRDALIEAANRRVKVWLLLDGFGCSAAEPDFFKPLEEAGGKFCRFLPSYGRRYLIRNHQKLAIADEKLAIIGGANIEDTYLDDTNENHWRDLWLLIEGPFVEPAAHYFDSLFKWTRTPNGKLRRLRHIVARHSDQRGVLQWKFSGPLSRKDRLPVALSRALKTAKRFDLIAAYFSPPWAFLRRLGRIAVRGHARIITASKSDNNATIAAARHTYSRLLRRGVEMYEYSPAKLHTKLAMIDDVVYIGSANLDFRSLYINMEVVLRIDDAAFAKKMRGYFDRELKDSEHITPTVHRQRAHLLRRIKWTLSYWMVTSMDYTVTRRLNFAER